MGLVVKVLCGHFCIACLRPLTRRYIFVQSWRINGHRNETIRAWAGVTSSKRSSR
ncbi:hypothetical protein H6S61_01890 [Vibrio vulnificus]|nr:hypothetical protein H6S61_01890 [Vibrio vulnificus]